MAPSSSIYLAITAQGRYYLVRPGVTTIDGETILAWVDINNDGFILPDQVDAYPIDDLLTIWHKSR